MADQGGPAVDGVLPEIVVSAPGIKAVNAASAASETRAPRGIVTVNGTRVAGWIDFTVKNNTFFEADTFEVNLAEDLLASPYDADGLSALASDTFVEILAGFPADPDSPNISELSSLIYGRIDDIAYNPKTHIVTLTGRDLTGAFIDTKAPRDFVNQTASQIALAIAKAHGMQSVITATTAKAGSLSQPGEYHLLQTEGSDWDLLVALARQAGFVCFVSGQTLYFQPQAVSENFYLITWTPPMDQNAAPSSNAKELTFSRSLTITKGVSVQVMSAGLFNKASITRSYPTAPRSIAPGKASPFGATTVYTYRVKAGWDAAHVEAFAQAQYELITSHAMKMHAELPADDVLFPRDVAIQVRGTGTQFDQTYYPRSVTRNFNLQDGYVMSVEAQNFTPNLAVS